MSLLTTLKKVQAQLRLALKDGGGYLVHGSVEITPEQAKFVIGKRVFTVALGAPVKATGKGNRGENVIAKLLSEWWGETGAFYRSAESGARFTRQEDRREHPGDLVVPEGFHWVVEAKWAQQFDLKSWLLDYDGSSFIAAALKQAIAAATPVNRWPVVIARCNNHPWMIFFPREMRRHIADPGYDRVVRQRHFEVVGPGTPLVRCWICLRLEDFTRAVSPDLLLDLPPWRVVPTRRGGRHAE